MRRYLVAKPAFPFYLWKRHRVLFLLVWRMTADDREFIVDNRFFFSLSSKESTRLSSFLLVLQFQSLCFLLLIFILGPFIYKKNYVFNLVLQLQFDNLSYIIFFQIRFLFFWFLINFSLALLLKFYWFSISSSNQSLYCFILFNLVLILLISFFFF